MRAFGFSIVNGAQTLGSAARYIRENGDPCPDGYVFLKVVSLERCEDDVAFAHRITQSTNFQNQIGSRDFVALDEQQNRIAMQLSLEGVEYHYKDDDDAPGEDESNFTLKEATLALASLEWGNEGELCAKALADLKALWSFEEIYPPTAPYRTRYQRLFRPDRSARTIWRAVQTRRVVVRLMQDEGRAHTGIRKAFFENARAVVLNVVFLKLRPQVSEGMALSADEVASITRMTIEAAEALWSACEDGGYVSRRATGTGGEVYEQTRHFRSVFSNPGDCHRLRNATLARLARREAGERADAPPNA